MANTLIMRDSCGLRVDTFDYDGRVDTLCHTVAAFFPYKRTVCQLWSRILHYAEDSDGMGEAKPDSTYAGRSKVEGEILAR